VPDLLPQTRDRREAPFTSAPAGTATQAINIVICDQFDDGPQGMGSMKAGRVEQRRVADGDGRDVHLADFHTPLTNTSSPCHSKEVFMPASLVIFST